MLKCPTIILIDNAEYEYEYTSLWRAFKNLDNHKNIWIVFFCEYGNKHQAKSQRDGIPLRLTPNQIMGLQGNKLTGGRGLLYSRDELNSVLDFNGHRVTSEAATAIFYFSSGRPGVVRFLIRFIQRQASCDYR